MKKSYLLLFLIIALFSCKTEKKKEKASYFTSYAEDNIFLDDALREVHDYEYTRSVADLIDFIETKGQYDPKYRISAIASFGSIQDTSTISVISTFLNDDNLNVRLAAIFALGQIQSFGSENTLIKAFSKEIEPKVKESILVAIGKCGGQNGLDFILSQATEKDGSFRLALSESLSRFTERKIFSQKAKERILQIISNKENSENTKLAISYAFARLEADTNFHEKDIIPLYKNCNLIYSKLNILKVLAKAPVAEISPVLLEDLNDKATDYRIKIGILQTLYKYDYDK